MGKSVASRFGRLEAIESSATGEVLRVLPPLRHRLRKPKFIRDPIHDLVRIDDKTVLKILDTQPLQRMKGIRQLGVASFVYPGAEHSRFAHSLGVYHLASKILSQIGESDYTSRLTIQLAALLHDTGHGPFSHLFEAALKEFRYKHFQSHENWTKEVVMSHPEVTSLLDARSKNLKRDVKDVISGSYRPPYLSSIVSSQVDADRLDYMLRDSHMTGVHYGRFDLNWMLRNLSVRVYEEKDEDEKKHQVEKIVIDARRGLSSLESYLLGNFYLYKHVYYHKTIQAAEGMLIKILLRAVDCAKASRKSSGFDPLIRKISANKKLTLAEYLSLTDSTINYWISTWAFAKTDRTLSDLCGRLLKRELLKIVPLSGVSPREYSRIVAETKQCLTKRKYEPRYFLIEGEPQRVAYKNLFFFRQSDKPSQEIYYLDVDDKVKPFTGIPEKHTISCAIIRLKLDENFLVVPGECVSDIKAIIKEVVR